MTPFFLAAAAMLVAALVLVLVPLLRRHPEREPAPALAPATLTGISAAILMPIAAVGLYLGITSYPWRGEPPGTAAPAGQPPSIETAIAQIEARLAVHPDDATGWRMLGRSRVMSGQFETAVAAYERAMALTGGRDPALRLDLAEALVLAGEPAAQDRAKQIVDDVLANDPANQKALWYAGVIALRAGDRATAKQRLSALRAQEPPGEIRGILDQQLAALEGAAAPAGSSPAAAPARGRTLRIAVSLGPEVAARVGAGVPVFISARQPGIPGPPLAALRLTSDALPVTVELSDANAMIEGRNLSSVDEVEVTARVAFGGTAMTAPGDLIGSARSKKADPAPLAIRIDREVR